MCSLHRPPGRQQAYPHLVGQAFPHGPLQLSEDLKSGPGFVEIQPRFAQCLVIVVAVQHLGEALDLPPALHMFNQPLDALWARHARYELLIDRPKVVVAERSQFLRAHAPQ